jgi:hypothetical protein
MVVWDEDGNYVDGYVVTILEGKTDPERRGCDPTIYHGGYCLFTDGGDIDGLYERLKVRVECEGYESVTRSFLFKSGYCGVRKVEGNTRVVLRALD